MSWFEGLKQPNGFAPGQIRATVGALQNTRYGEDFHKDVRMPDE
jgi:hypothetical protein